MDIDKNNFLFLKEDIFGGITAAVVALPLALAFGVSSGLGAMAGLYGAIIVGFFASVFGGTPKQISGPTGPMTVIVALIFVEFNFRAEIVFFCISFAGVLQIIFGILKFGNLVKYIPQSVVSGFMTGIGLIIIFLQLPILLGLGGETTIVLSLTKLKSIYNFNPNAVAVSIICLGALFFLPSRIFKIIPSPIIILIIGSIFSIFFFNNQLTIGTIPKGLPKINIFIPEMQEIYKIVFYSFLLALLGIIDSLLTSIVADQITNDKHQPNKETIGQGVGNIISGFFGGLAGAGATMRTVVNIKAGGQTRISGIAHSAFLLLVVTFFSSAAEIIPLSALSAILIKVGIDIIDWNFFKKVKTIPILDIFITFLVIFLTVFVNLIIAVVLGSLFYIAWKKLFTY